MSDQSHSHDTNPRIDRDSDTGTRLPYEVTAAGQDDTPIEHTYQTADGREVTERIRTADATFVPNEGDGKIETPPSTATELQEKAA